MKLGSADVKAVFIKHSSPKKLFEVAERLRETNQFGVARTSKRPKIILCMSADASRGILDNIRNAKGRTWNEKFYNASREYFKRFSTAPVVDIEAKPSTLIDIMS